MPKTADQIQREILEDYINDVIKEIIAAQNSAVPWPFRASGQLQAKMRVQYSTASDTAFLEAPNYLPTTFEGNGIAPGRVFPWRQLTQWLRFKPIQGVRDERGRFLPRTQIAFLMARKMWLEGNALFRGDRQGIPINRILRKNLPKTGRRLADNYAREFIRQTKKAMK